MPSATTYVLGKDCVLAIDGEQIDGVSDVVVRETTTEIDATGFDDYGTSTVVVGRTLEIALSLPDIKKARELYAKRFIEKWTGDRLFYLPRLLLVELSGGLFEITGSLRHFTVHSIDGDELLDGAVIPRFELREWSGFTQDDSD